MGLFSGRKPHSGLVAKERLSNLLMAERLNCSPASLQMLKNDLSAAAGNTLPLRRMKFPSPLHKQPLSY